MAKMHQQKGKGSKAYHPSKKTKSVKSLAYGRGAGGKGGGSSVTRTGNHKSYKVANDCGKGR